MKEYARIRTRTQVMRDHDDLLCLPPSRPYPTDVVNTWRRNPFTCAAIRGTAVECAVLVMKSWCPINK